MAPAANSLKGSGNNNHRRSTSPSAYVFAPKWMLSSAANAASKKQSSQLVFSSFTTSGRVNAQAMKQHDTDSRTTYIQSSTSSHIQQQQQQQQQPKIPHADRFDSEFPTLVADMETKPRAPTSAWGNPNIIKEKVLSPPSSTDTSVEDDSAQDPEIERLKALVPKRGTPRKGPAWAGAHPASTRSSPSTVLRRQPGSRARGSGGGSHTARKSPLTKPPLNSSDIPKKEAAAIVKLPLALKSKRTQTDQNTRRYQTSSRSSLESYDNVDDLAMTISLSSGTSQTSYLESPRTLLEYEDDDKRPVSPLDEGMSIRNAVSDDDKQRFINFICDRVCYHGGWGNSIRKAVMVEGEEKYHYELDSGSFFSVRY